MSKNLIYGIKDRPPFGKMLIFAFQQFLAILAATIAVPTIIGLPTQIPAAIFGAGIGTLIYQLLTKFKDVIADQTIAGIHVGLFRKGVQRTSGKELKFESK